MSWPECHKGGEFRFHPLLCFPHVMFHHDHHVHLVRLKRPSCQCLTTLYGMQEETKKQCEYNSLAIAEYAGRFPRGHWSFLGPGSEEKWYGNMYSQTRWILGSNGRTNVGKFLSIGSSDISCFQCFCKRRITRPSREKEVNKYTLVVAQKPSSCFSAQ